MNLALAEVERNTNNVMAFKRKVSYSWSNPSAVLLFVLCLGATATYAQEAPANEPSDSTIGEGLTQGDVSLDSPEEGIIDSTPRHVHQIVDESRKTSVTFYHDIQPFSAGLKEVTQRTNLSIGYRILVMSDRSEAVVNQVMDDFYRSYRNLPTYKVFNSPYTELKVGDFSTYLEASYWAYQMKSEFRGAYVVQEVVNRRKK